VSYTTEGDAFVKGSHVLLNFFNYQRHCVPLNK
jgi:hypothetical protein